MNQQTAQKILDDVKQTYNDIAPDFDKTRAYVWPGIKAFVKYVGPNDKVLDLGCGNGKLRLLFKDVKIDYTGADNSSALLKLAGDKADLALPGQKFAEAEVFNLPFVDNSFDAVFFLAVLHHIPGKDLRLKTLREINRVLKPGGVLVMTSWNRWQNEYNRHIFKYTLLKLFGKSELDFKDFYLPWMGGKAYRYYHAFTLGEVKRLVKKSGLKLEENYLAKFDGAKVSSLAYLTAANLVAVARKARFNKTIKQESN